MKRKWPREDALEVARELCAKLKPVCERLIVAGSLRRRKEEVGDVEIVFIPKMVEGGQDLFEKRMVSAADAVIEGMLEDGTLLKRVSEAGHAAWGAQNKLGVHRSGMPVDLFRTTEGAWWNYVVCRTGPADSNKRIAVAAQRVGYQWNPYGAGFSSLSADGKVPVMGSEREVFEFVGLPYKEPWERY